MANSILIVGGQGTGKTHFAKQVISKVPRQNLLVFDVNNEYKDFYPYPFNPDIDAFLSKVLERQNGVILVEDATAFLSNRGRKDSLVKALVSKRHSNNTYILLFHSFRAVPKYIFDLCNKVVIFKTNDPESLIQNAFQNDELTQAWKEVQDAAKDHEFFSVYPRPEGVAPPSKIVTLY